MRILRKIVMGHRCLESSGPHLIQDASMRAIYQAFGGHDMWCEVYRHSREYINEDPIVHLYIFDLRIRMRC